MDCQRCENETCVDDCPGCSDCVSDTCVDNTNNCSSADCQICDNASCRDHCLDEDLVCDGAGVCVECVVDADCIADPNGEICDPNTNTCVECLIDPNCPAGFVCEDLVCVPLVTIEADIEDPVVNGFASGVASITMSIDGEPAFDASSYVTWNDNVGHLEFVHRGEVTAVVLVVEDHAGNVRMEMF
jgi:hypothetical protein